MIYVSEFFHAFASSQDRLKVQAARSLRKFVGCLRKLETLQVRKLETLQVEYESRARALVQWAQEMVVALSACHLGDSMEDCQLAFGYFCDYLVNKKPRGTATKLSLESLYVQLQTEFKVCAAGDLSFSAFATSSSLSVALFGFLTSSSLILLLLPFSEQSPCLVLLGQSLPGIHRCCLDPALRSGMSIWQRSVT